MLIQAWMRLCKTRPQGMSGPANLPRTDIESEWKTSGSKAAGMPMEEFIDLMVSLDDVFKADYKRRHPA